MAADEPDEGFKVTDRRRRADDDAAPPRGVRAEPPPRVTAPPPPPREPTGVAERSLVGLFMMLGSSALMALGFSFGPLVVRALMPPATVASYTPAPIPPLPAAAVNVLLLMVLSYALVQASRSARATRLLRPIWPAPRPIDGPA